MSNCPLSKARFWPLLILKETLSIADLICHVRLCVFEKTALAVLIWACVRGLIGHFGLGVFQRT